MTEENKILVENKNLIEAGGRIVRARRTMNGNVVMTLLINDHRHISRVPFLHHGLIDRSLMGNAKVEVKGHVYVSSGFDEIVRRPVNQTMFLVDDIQLRKTQMEEAFGVPGRFCGTDYFVGKFTGTVDRLVHSSNENWGTLFVLVDGYNGNTPSSVAFNYYLKGKLPSFEHFKEGDRVAIVSSVHTTTKTIREEERTFVNLGVEDIVKINESAEDEPDINSDNADSQPRETSRERRRKRRMLLFRQENMNRTDENTAGGASSEDGSETVEEAGQSLEAEGSESQGTDAAPAAQKEVSEEVPADSGISDEGNGEGQTDAPQDDTLASDTAEDAEEKTSLYHGNMQNRMQYTAPEQSDVNDADDGAEDSESDPSDHASGSYYEVQEEDDDDEDYDDSDFLQQFKSRK